MGTQQNSDFPWDLVAESLTGSITADEDAQLQQWISSDPENQKRFLEIRELWKNGMEDYRFYRMANESEGWNTLYAKMGRTVEEKKEDTMSRDPVFRNRRFIRNLLAYAAILSGVVGLIWIITDKRAPVMYVTASDEQKKVTLEDGTKITLHPLTRIGIPRSYNITERSLSMDSGEADFEVVHLTGKPFIVEMGNTSVTDIGTSFIIRRDVRMIHVAVAEGKVAFVKTATNETREIDAGGAITYDVGHDNFGEIGKIESSKAVEQLLIFENAPLTEVLVSVQKVYGHPVIIDDSIANKKLTAKLFGMPFHTAIQVICTSLGLEYSVHDSIYTLKAKTIEQP